MKKQAKKDIFRGNKQFELFAKAQHFLFGDEFEFEGKIYLNADELVCKRFNGTEFAVVTRLLIPFEKI